MLQYNRKPLAVNAIQLLPETLTEAQANFPELEIEPNSVPLHGTVWVDGGGWIVGEGYWLIRKASDNSLMPPVTTDAEFQLNYDLLPV